MLCNECHVGNISNTNLHSGQCAIRCLYCTCVRDLGVWIDDKLKFHEHTSVIAKANRILALMKRSFNIYF